MGLNLRQALFKKKLRKIKKFLFCLYNHSCYNTSERKKWQMKKFILSIYMVLFLFVSIPVYAAEVEPLKGIAVVDVESLNVRSGPSKNYDKLGTLSQYVEVKVKGIVEPDWYVIDFDGEEGYISSDYVIFTPEDEIEGGFKLVAKKYLVMALVVIILILSGTLIYTFMGIKKKEDDDEEDYIPITDHDDTNMHMGEVTYDTYRIDIDPKYFEQTTIIPQPDSIYDENGDAPWRKDLFSEEVKQENVVVEQITSETDIQSLDSKLEQASAQIAALQKEVEQLKKQQPDS